MVLTDSKLKFLSGTQSALDGLLTNTSTINKDNIGSFYLTSDTHRLYIQESATSIVPVNEGITTVANLTALEAITPSKANAGQFYYITSENILAVSNGKGWVQINAVEDTQLVSATDAVTVSAVSDNSTTITTLVKDDAENEVTGNFIVKDSTQANTIVVNGNTVDIQGDSYTISGTKADTSNKAVVTVASAHTDTSSQVTFTAGDNVSITDNGTNEFKISSSFENTVIKSDEEKGIELTYDGFAEGTNGDLTITIIDSDEEKHTATVNLGKYYTEAEIDKKFKNLNGLKYIGTIASSFEIPSSGVESGYMYLISGEEVKFNDSLTAIKGDIVIATGTEDSDGYLTAITWTHIPSGDDIEIDTTYHLAGVTHGVSLYNESEEGTAGSFVLEAGDVITLSDDNSTTDGSGVVTKKVKVEHSDVTNTKTSSDKIPEDSDISTITYVSDVVVNDQGHTTQVDLRKATIKDTTYELSGANLALDEDTNTVTVTDTLTDLFENEEAGTSKFALTSETLTLSTATATNTVPATLSLIHI